MKSAPCAPRPPAASDGPVLVVGARRGGTNDGSRHTRQHRRLRRNSMKTSIAIATILVASASAAGVAALPNPWDGSDTLFAITQAVIAAQPSAPLNTEKADYVGGGSGGGAAAMAGASSDSPFTAGTQLQDTAPMSRMIKKEGTFAPSTAAPTGAATTTRRASSSPSTAWTSTPRTTVVAPPPATA